MTPEEELAELKQAMHDSRMGLMRTSDGKVRICYTPEAEAEFNESTDRYIGRLHDEILHTKPLVTAVLTEEAHRDSMQDIRLLYGRWSPRYWAARRLFRQTSKAREQATIEFYNRTLNSVLDPAEG